jgi:predicted outer membrane protein
MSRLTPYRGTLLQLALANALLVGMVAATFLFVTRASGPGGRLGSSAVMELDAGPVGTSRVAELPAADQALLLRLAELITQEIQLAEMARERASHLALRRLAHQIVTQHRQVRKEVAAIAGDRGLELAGTDNHRGAGAPVAASAGDEFDAAFLRWTTVNQAAALRECEQALELVRDPQVRNLAERAIPVLQGFHDQARRLQRAF